MSSSSKAIPLCIPDSSSWDSRNRVFSTDKNKTRTKLVVVKEALDQLQQIKDPVCVVSIAGPCRQGKSYILSKTFEQDCVFPLGHQFDPETMGIWMWIVPKKYKTKNGIEFTVVLLDSEGTDAVTAAIKDDYPIFTLITLLASFLMYNSAGVPKRTDLEKLDFIVNLSQQIQSSTHDGSDGVPAKRHQLSKTFPFFFWLLRDITQTLPRDCANVKEFFLKRVFNEQGENSMNDGGAAQEAANTILSAFSGFDAFMLPSPSTDAEEMKLLNGPASEGNINKKFFTGVKELKKILEPNLYPKKSFNEGEYVTGEALVGLLTHYVNALNTPGVVPNIPSTWNVIVKDKCTKALTASFEVYETEMNESLKDKLPCSDEKLARSHEAAFHRSQQKFKEEVRWIKALTVENYLAKLTNDIQGKLRHWESKNNQESEKLCKQILKNLDKEYFTPILVRLEVNAQDLTTADIMAAYDSIEQGYRKEAKGAGNVQARVFTEFHPEITAKLNRFVHQLEQLKDYDKKLMEEKMARAKQEQKRVRLENEREKMEQEIRLQEREKEILQEKHRNDMLQQKLQHKQKISEQIERDKNMLMAEMKEQMEKNAKIREQEREKDEEKRIKEREDFEQKLAAKDEETNRLRQDHAKQLQAEKEATQRQRDQKDKWKTKASDAERERDKTKTEARTQIQAAKQEMQEAKSATAQAQQKADDLRNENERLMGRGLLDRVFNKRV